MGLGYEGSLTIDGVTCLATSGNVTVLRDIIMGGGGYGGQMSGTHMGTGAPHVWDPFKTTSNVTFDITKSSATALSNKINNRDSTYTLSMKLGHECSSTSVNQYWTEISFSASAGGIASATIGGVIFEKSSLGGACISESPVRDGGNCEELVPYYLTSFSLGDCVQDWTARISQSVSPIYCCNASGDSDGLGRSPDYVLLGEVEINLDVTCAGGGDFPVDTSLTITAGEMSLDFGRCQILSFSDNLASGTSPNTSSASYRAFRYD